MSTEDYVRRIRNPHKRAYAEAFLAMLRNGGAEPRFGDFAPLSYMGAQAVRLRIMALVHVDAA